MTKLRVAVIFGGQSEEHDVSVKSAAEIAAGIDTAKYEPIYVGISRAGEWKLCERPHAGWEKNSSIPAAISPDSKERGLLVKRDRGYELLHIDVALPIIHGKTGEDGTIQGLLELSGIPYTGCDIQSSALCMDKSLAYVVCGAAGISVPDFLIVNGDDMPDAHPLVYPVFVKPARSGSSFGVKKVERADELQDAVLDARRYDDKVLIEQAVTGCEVGCAVLGNGAELTTGEIDQITLTHGFFRIHQESAPETGSENAVIKVPADIPRRDRERVRRTAMRIYRALGCRGLARVDMFLREDGRILLNEVNTSPGFTSYSRYPRMMSAAGMSFTELLDRLIELAQRSR
jgi:D-alanine--(R)-lactate ligase